MPRTTHPTTTGSTCGPSSRMPGSGAAPRPTPTHTSRNPAPPPPREHPDTTGGGGWVWRVQARPCRDAACEHRRAPRWFCRSPPEPLPRLTPHPPHHRRFERQFKAIDEAVAKAAAIVPMGGDSGGNLAPIGADTRPGSCGPQEGIPGASLDSSELETQYHRILLRRHGHLPPTELPPP
eukprot:scaffold19375_cov103-Isochrysis_galbana.AAC.5